jgi:hypothetical protein
MFNFSRFSHLNCKPDALIFAVSLFFFGVVVTATAQALV